jgi:ribosomal protein L2
MARSPHDDRSDSKNPDSDSRKAAQDNRASQLNPNNKEHGGGQAQQRQPSTQDRDFAPGEDGECH